MTFKSVLLYRDDTFGLIFSLLFILLKSFLVVVTMVKELTNTQHSSDQSLVIHADYRFRSLSTLYSLSVGRLLF